MGGRIIGGVILNTATLPGYLVDGTSVYVQQLHSTKGWRPPYWDKWRSATTVPVIGKFHWAEGVGPNREYQHAEIKLRGMRHLARHGWWRRKVRKEGTQEERGYLAAWENAHAKLRQL